MPRSQAGYKYPHVTTDARKHECRLCEVVGKIAERAAAGDEEWGTAHHMPPVNASEERAEEIRDSALAISGLLNKRIGGPSFMPYQPPDFYKNKNEGWQWTPSGGTLDCVANFCNSGSTI